MLRLQDFAGYLPFPSPRDRCLNRAYHEGIVQRMLHVGEWAWGKMRLASLERRLERRGLDENSKYPTLLLRLCSSEMTGQSSGVYYPVLNVLQWSKWLWLAERGESLGPSCCSVVGTPIGCCTMTGHQRGVSPDGMDHWMRIPETCTQYPICDQPTLCTLHLVSKVGRHCIRSRATRSFMSRPRGNGGMGDASSPPLNPCPFASFLSDVHLARRKGVWTGGWFVG